ncbi:DUF5681 domain-containing protein [Euryhalocaulis caribicus]|uniref:DUF5681 domain-containing protein n=1 Tax=Euryhalocaulis caribicus TaxID=1161401 RepID=UPI0003A51B70|nr:DUF5681 domain-containing protein [Euryhalocaulis caribicus]
MTRKHKKRDYEIGYGKPPRHSRFKPGQSGNPKGRPKGARNAATVIRRLLDTNIAVREGGKTRHAPFMEVMLRKMSHGAINGSMKDQVLFLKTVQTYMPEALEEPKVPLDVRVRFVEARNGRPVEVPEEDLVTYTQEEWLARAEAEKTTGKGQADDKAAETAGSAEADEDDDMSFLD